MQVMKKYEQLLEASHAGPIPNTLVAEVEAAKETADLEFLVKEIPKAIQQSLAGTERVSKIVQSMKDFAYPGTNYKAAADLNKAIESTITKCPWQRVETRSRDSNGPGFQTYP